MIEIYRCQEVFMAIGSSAWMTNKKKKKYLRHDALKKCFKKELQLPG